MGFGTQKVEGELYRQLSGAKVLRMDADTTSTRQDYEAMLDTFRQGEADILLGTQMVTKGHDFPQVTLVGVMLADTGLYANDFRASERTFSLLTQVIGRAGRANNPGEAIIQTFSPQNDVIRLAKAQDYVAFYESQIKLREELCFPPFCDMVQLTFISHREDKVKTAAEAAFTRIRELTSTTYRNIPLEVFGPMEAQVYKLNEQYRMRLVIKCRWNAETRALFRILLSEGWERQHTSVSIDVNPLHA
jgi:primosomal protein N' (replication factor Y)